LSCETEEWGDWSDCSTACGEGIRSRKRYYVEQDTAQCSEELYQTQACQESSGCQDSVPSLPNPQRRTRYDDSRGSADTSSYSRYDEPRGTYGVSDPQCAVAEWSDWSPCSVSCGHGYNIRTRVFLLSFVPNRVCEGVRLTEKKDCRYPSCWNDDYYSDNEDMELAYDDLEDVQDMDQVGYGSVPDPEAVRESLCEEEMDPGICIAMISRWYYNAEAGSCEEFKYTGCGGNKNNFVTLQSCMETCQNHRTQDVFKSLMPMSLVREDYTPDPVDCQVTDWSDWSECSEQCGRGWMTRSRDIIAQPLHGGRPCPRKLVKRKKCRGYECAAQPANWYQGNWRMLQGDE